MINLANTIRLLNNKVKFIRLIRVGEIHRRIFSYRPNAVSSNSENPAWMAGDIVRMLDSALCTGIRLLSEDATPFVGVSGSYSIGMS